jgi:hypothetical protein
MAGQTKMLIITSDEDIIRRFSLDKTKNTHIIDLRNDNQGTSIKKVNKNISDLAFFAGLSQLVCILYLYKSLKLKTFICRIQAVIKYTNVHLIHLIIVDQNQLKDQRNRLILFVVFVVIVRLDLIMMFFHVLHVKRFFVEMVIKNGLV